jgi:hypothetical protein
MWQITTKHFMFCILSNPNIFLRLKITDRNENHVNWPVMVQETSHIVYSVPARNWKWRGVTLEKGHFSASKTMKKGNIVLSYFQLLNLILEMSFSTTFSALCINASTWLIVYIYFITLTYVHKCMLKSEDQ